MSDNGRVPLGPYVSCIKLGNKPIIPPLMTDERIQKMQYYRELAVAVEKRKRRKRLSIDSGVMTSSVESSVMKQSTVENPTLDDGTPPKVEDSQHEENIETCKERRNSYTLATPSPILLAYVQSLQGNSHHDDENNVYELFMNTKNDLDRYSVDCDVTAAAITEHHVPEPFPEVKIKSKRKLWELETRRLSLENGKLASVSNSQYVSLVPLKRSFGSAECLRQLTSYDDKEYACKIQSPVGEGEYAGQIQSQVDDGEYAHKVEPQMDESSTVDVVETDTPEKANLNDSFNKDFSLLDVSVNNESRESDVCRESTISDCSSVSLSKFIPFLDKKPSSDNEEGGAEYEAFLYLKEQLSLKHRKELSLLLETQQKEHDFLKEEYRKMSRASSRSKSSPCSVSTSLNFQKSPNSKFNESFAQERGSVLRQKSPSSKFNEPFAEKRSSVQQNSPMISDTQRRHRAASIINAAARGYLTRRLFKTERVILLVQTIKDCLLTAVSLQNEMNLGLSELDLQNRLLQQLTVACNELYQLFALPVEERLVIISMDREKKNRISHRSHTPLPLSEATKRTLMRKTTNSAPVEQKKHFRKRCQSLGCGTSESRSCGNTPVHVRPIVSTIVSQKNTLSQCNRRPWR